MALKIGDKAPEILGVDQDGKEIKLSEYKGEKVILYFYPKDNTPGCSAEACSLRDGYDELRQKGYEVIGVSKDSQKSHKNFIEKKSLLFNLMSDADIKLQEEFGVWREKSMCGKKYMGTVRTTFIINEEGIIEKVIEKVDTKNAAGQILSL